MDDNHKQGILDWLVVPWKWSDNHTFKMLILTLGSHHWMKKRMKMIKDYWLAFRDFLSLAIEL